MAITYSLSVWERIRGRALNTVLLSCSSEPYSSGIAPDLGAMGVPSSLDSLVVFSATPGDSKIYKFDQSSNKIRIYAQAASSAGSLYAEVSGNQTVDMYVLVRGW